MDKLMAFCLKNIRCPGVQIFIKRDYKKRIFEIGKLEHPKVHEQYIAGQFFIHKVFSYRGVILYPLTARLYDRNAEINPLAWFKILLNKKLNINRNGEEEVEPFVYNGEVVRGKIEMYYHVLIDSRDVPFVRSDTNRITFIRHENKPRKLVPFPAMDYVAHDEIIPYTPTEKQPIQHELLETFFIYRADQYPVIVPKDTINKFKETFHFWIKLRDIHKETTRQVRVTIIPFYVGIHKSDLHWWRYILRVENMSDQRLELLEVYLHVVTLTQVVEEVREIRLKHPLTQEEPASQFTMQICLEETKGYVMGVLRMERRDGSTFYCKIPAFVLDSKGK